MRVHKLVNTDTSREIKSFFFKSARRPFGKFITTAYKSFLTVKCTNEYFKDDFQKVYCSILKQDELLKNKIRDMSYCNFKSVGIKLLICFLKILEKRIYWNPRCRHNIMDKISWGYLVPSWILKDIFRFALLCFW